MGRMVLILDPDPVCPVCSMLVYSTPVKYLGLFFSFSVHELGYQTISSSGAQCFGQFEVAALDVCCG